MVLLRFPAGVVPPQLRKLTALTGLSLSSNRLWGESLCVSLGERRARVRESGVVLWRRERCRHMVPETKGVADAVLVSPRGSSKGYFALTKGFDDETLGLARVLGF